MTIGGVDCGARNPPATDTPRRITSWGRSMAGVVSKYDGAMNVQEVDIVFLMLTTAVKDSLKAALEVTAKPGGTVVVVPDSGDGLEVGAAGSTNFTYRGGFRAEYNQNANGTWRVVVPLLYIATGV